MDVLRELDDHRCRRRLMKGSAAGVALGLGLSVLLGVGAVSLAALQPVVPFVLVLGVILAVVGARLGNLWALATF